MTLCVLKPLPSGPITFNLSEACKTMGTPNKFLMGNLDIKQMSKRDHF